MISIKNHLLPFSLVMGIFLFISNCHLATAGDRIRSSNIHYKPGDWITYSMTRFVNSVTIGNQYIYFGTTGGITRYDFWANKWDFPWTSSNGLANNNIKIVAFDFDTGYLWCTTATSISRMESASQRWYNDFYDEMGMSSGDWGALIGIDREHIWVKTAAGMVLSGDKISGSFARVPSVNIFNVNTEEIKWYDGGKKKESDRLPHFFPSGSYLFDESGYIRDMELREFEVTCWVRDKWQNMWIGTWGLGAARGDLPTQRLEFLYFGLWDEPVDAIAWEGDNFWLGGVNNVDEPSGVTLWRGESERPEYFESYLLTGFYNDAITAIAVDGRYLWFGTQDGLTRYHKTRDSWYTYTTAHNLANNWVHDILVDEDYVWIATASGVSRLYKATIGTDSLLIQHVNWPALRNIEVFDLDAQLNLIWMATEFGIYVYDNDLDEGGFYKGFKGPANQLIKAVSCFEKEVWFGTLDGIEAFDAKKKDWLPSPARRYGTGFEVNRILAAKDAVWAVTNKGVLKYDRQFKRWVHFTTKDGLISNHVYSVLLDGDYIWFGSDKGLTRFYWNDPTRTD